VHGFNFVAFGHPTIQIGYLYSSFCFVCLVSQTICPPLTCLVPSESPRRGGVHGLCFVVFGPMMGKLLNFKVFI